MVYYEPRLPCDATQLRRFRVAIGEVWGEELLKVTMDAAVTSKAIDPKEFERVIVDTTVQEKAVAHPVGSRLLEIARHKVVKALGMEFKQTFAKEGKALRFMAGRYAHAKQFKRLKKVLKRQRTILGIVLRQVQGNLDAGAFDVAQTSPAQLVAIKDLMQRADRLRTQQPKDKNKLYAPEVECVSKGKARKPYEFGVKASIAITHKSGLVVGARTFPGSPYDGHTLAEQLQQTSILLQDIGKIPKQVVVELGYQCKQVQADNPGIELLHRGRFKSMSQQQRKWLKRRQAVEPEIGHLKGYCRMNRCHLKGQLGDALRATTCAGS